MTVLYYSMYSWSIILKVGVRTFSILLRMLQLSSVSLPQLAVFCFLLFFLLQFLSQFFSKEEPENTLSCFQVHSKTVGVSEDSTVIVALVVLTSSASAGFSGCQKWNKRKAAATLLEVLSCACEQLRIFLLELDGLLSMSAACVPVVFSFWERSISARQVSWLCCGWTGELNLFTISRNCFSTVLALSLLVVVHGLQPKVCCLPVSSIPDPLIQS